MKMDAQVSVLPKIPMKISAKSALATPGVWVSWMLVLVGVAMLMLVVGRDARLAFFGERTQGRVVEPSEPGLFAASGSGGVPKVMHVRFTPKEGAEVTFRVSSTFRSAHLAGEVVPVVYLESDPRRAQIHTMKQVWLPLLVGSGFGGVVLGAGLLMILVRRGWRPVWR